MPFRERSRFLTLAVAVVAGIAGATAACAEDVIQFGAALSLTGGLATEAQSAKAGYDFYLKHINDLGGINIGGKRFKVAIKYYDDGSNTNTSVQLY